MSFAILALQVFEEKAYARESARVGGCSAEGAQGAVTHMGGVGSGCWRGQTREAGFWCQLESVDCNLQPLSPTPPGLTLRLPERRVSAPRPCCTGHGGGCNVGLFVLHLVFLVWNLDAPAGLGAWEWVGVGSTERSRGPWQRCS